MTLRHFEIFKTVAETGNFTKAAEKLYISQSGVSHAIHDLEQQAGTPLFIRLSKSVQLTEGGKLLLKEILPILSSCHALEAKIPRLEASAPLHIVSSITIASFWLPGILKKFQKHCPDTPVEVNVVSAANAFYALEQGSADIALAEGTIPSGSFHILRFDSCDLTAVCAPGYPMPNSPLTARALCQENLLLREKGSAVRDTFDSALYLQGCTPHPVWISVNSNALIQAAKAGLGITVLPEILVQEAIEKNELRKLELEDLHLQNELSLLYHKTKYLTEPLELFIQEVIRASSH